MYNFFYCNDVNFSLDENYSTHFEASLYMCGDGENINNNLLTVLWILMDIWSLPKKKITELNFLVIFFYTTKFLYNINVTFFFNTYKIQMYQILMKGLNIFGRWGPLVTFVTELFKVVFRWVFKYYHA